MHRVAVTVLVLGLFGILSIALAGCPGGTWSSTGSQQDWLTDYEAAKEAAREEGKLILADFSGSNWCGWCKKLDAEVFAEPAFKAYAKENLVLLLVDFPRPDNQPQTVKDQNSRLLAEHGVQGFPTVLILDADGTALARTGYRKGGAEGYVNHLEGLIAKKR